MQQLKQLYTQWNGKEPEKMEKLPGAGSNREYYRIFGAEGKTVIGCKGTSKEENHAFLVLARHFTKRKLPVPHILA